MQSGVTFTSTCLITCLQAQAQDLCVEMTHALKRVRNARALNAIGCEQGLMKAKAGACKAASVHSHPRIRNEPVMNCIWVIVYEAVYISSPGCRFHVAVVLCNLPFDAALTGGNLYMASRSEMNSTHVSSSTTGESQTVCCHRRRVSPCACLMLAHIPASLLGLAWQH